MITQSRSLGAMMKQCKRLGHSNLSLLKRQIFYSTSMLADIVLNRLITFNVILIWILCTNWYYVGLLNLPALDISWYPLFACHLFPGIQHIKASLSKNEKLYEQTIPYFDRTLYYVTVFSESQPDYLQIQIYTRSSFK